MSLSAEAIISVVAVLVGLPSAALILWKLYKARRRDTTPRPIEPDVEHAELIQLTEHLDHVEPIPGETSWHGRRGPGTIGVTLTLQLPSPRR